MYGGQEESCSEEDRQESGPEEEITECLPAQGPQGDLHLPGAGAGASLPITSHSNRDPDMRALHGVNELLLTVAGWGTIFFMGHGADAGGQIFFRQ